MKTLAFCLALLFTTSFACQPTINDALNPATKAPPLPVPNQQTMKEKLDADIGTKETEVQDAKQEVEDAVAEVKNKEKELANLEQSNKDATTALTTLNTEKETIEKKENALQVKKDLDAAKMKTVTATGKNTKALADLKAANDEVTAKMGGSAAEKMTAAAAQKAAQEVADEAKTELDEATAEEARLETAWTTAKADVTAMDNDTSVKADKKKNADEITKQQGIVNDYINKQKEVKSAKDAQKDAEAKQDDANAELKKLKDQRAALGN
uniref:DUF148 domain-containing protein n=2 Tax=Steinernema glaseri TaxID=37863 RepID=A0A1I8ATB0_9BILA